MTITRARALELLARLERGPSLSIDAIHRQA
jgi:hypothetical protein